MTAQSSCPSRLKRAAKARGLRIVKIRENSRDYVQYGPYMLIDLNTNGAVRFGVEVSDLAGAIERL